MPVAPYGSWRSPITPDALVERMVRIGDLAVESGALWWLESRPAEAGRQVIVRGSIDDGAARDVLPAGFSARTTVHEYGGGSFTVHKGSVFFSNFDDQRLWRIDDHNDPRPLTPEPPASGAWRYADTRVTDDGAWVVCVRERHAGGATGSEGVVNDLAAVPASGGDPITIAEGHDFFAAPRPSPDGRQLAWLAWDHPNMPWDGTQLWVADLVAGGGEPVRLRDARVIAGGKEDSISQPRWSPDGRLHWVSDRSGWWNLYVDDGARGRPLAPRPAEFSRPDWVFGQSTYAFLPDGRIVAVWSQDGIDAIAVLDPESARFEPLATPYTVVDSLHALPPRADRPAGSVVALAASPTDDAAVVELPLGGGRRVLRRSREGTLDPAFVSEAQPIEFSTTGGARAHAFYYPPANPQFEGPPHEHPPLLVTSHGGPTSAASPGLDRSIQFWTTRGFAVAAVNYGGSSGFGRAYRRRLDGQWGIVDVDDCVHAARHLATAGLVDGRRMAIRGSSAGGFTVLCALTFPDSFAAGTSLYGVADLEGLVIQTHKFESHYLDRLVAPYPEGRAKYQERSPMYFADRIRCPVLLLQGLEDRVVPPAQAEAMVAALRERRLPFAYVAFEGEQHGFRRAETIRRAVELELAFYGEVLGFEPAGTNEGVVIENLVPDQPR
ncbi:MAG: prolyl oligopeptidase family serine peptidase [Actinomycetota bacterium]|nr:prolyl oligopeptidase family serine peptidase [Actinomycetota bacterium]